MRIDTLDRKLIKPMTLVRIGLAFVFLATSIGAFFSPAELVEVLERSFISTTLQIPVSVFLLVIGINDAIVALLLFSNRGMRIVSIWAAAWFVGVFAARAAPLEILEELGYFFMALALIRYHWD